MKYRREIDGLRAVAILSVIFFHAGFSSFGGGFIGVDVFFVISGYLITTQIIEEKRKGEFSLGFFYERRIRRILPALFFMMAVCVPFAWGWMPPANMKDFSESLVAVVTFSSNVLFWSEAGYFDTESELKPLLHTWSLAVEEQFYIVLPLLLGLVVRNGKLRWVWLLFLFGLTSLIFSEWQSGKFPRAAFFLLFARFWELLAGTFVAIILLYREAIKKRLDLNTGCLASELCSITGLLMLIVPIFLYEQGMPFPGFAALPPVLGTGLVILAAQPDTVVGRLLGWRPLVGVGLISYSAYLWHQPLFAFAKNHGSPSSDQTESLVLIAATLGLAYLTWVYVERPFRKRTNFSGRKMFFAAAGVSMLFVAFGVAGHLSKGFVNYRGDEQVRLALKSAQRDPDAPNCTSDGNDYRKPVDSCVLGNGPVRIAVIGDSHASILSYQMSRALEANHTALRQLSFSGCEPTHGREELSSACARWTREAVDFLMNSPELDIVIVVYRLNAHLFGSHHRVYPEQPNFVDPEVREARWNAYVRLLDDLRAAGKKVIVVLPVPEVRRRMHDLIFSNPEPGSPIIGVTREWWDSRNDFVRARLPEIQASALVVDPTELYCDSQNCWATKNGDALYFDHNHLSRAGSIPLARLVTRCIAERDLFSDTAPLADSSICGPQ